MVFCGIEGSSCYLSFASLCYLLPCTVGCGDILLCNVLCPGNQVHPSWGICKQGTTMQFWICCHALFFVPQFSVWCFDISPALTSGVLNWKKFRSRKNNPNSCVWETFSAWSSIHVWVPQCNIKSWTVLWNQHEVFRQKVILFLYRKRVE